MYKTVGNYLFNILSFKTNRKIVVIESDDWGSTRTSNLATLKHLNKISSIVQEDRFTQLDNLASKEDLTLLFEVLSSIKDCNGDTAKLTANVCMANPDFNKIKESDFEEFFHMPFYENIGKLPNGSLVLQLWQEGIESGIFYPQLHGREHLHALSWLEELRNNNTELLKAFELETWGIPYISSIYKKRKNLQAALDLYGMKGEKSFQESWVRQGCEMFEKHFGYKSKTFIAPAYIWHNKITSNLIKQDIQAVQGIKVQFKPKTNNTGYSKIPHYLGQGKKLTYLIRNVFFEPASKPNANWVDITLSNIEKAFKNRLPAIIGSHRINFIGSLNPTHRDKNLECLTQILKKVIAKWPEVEFMSSDSFLDTMR